MAKPQVRSTLLGLVCSALVLACEEHTGPQPIPERRVTSVAPRQAVANATNEMRFSGMPGAAPAPTRPSAGRIGYEVPESWIERAPTPTRYADFQVGGDPRAECYLTLLPGDAGGLAANVNRWRAQMGQGSLTDEEIRLLPKRPILGREATLVELSGDFAGMTGDPQPDFALLGAIFSVPEGTLFVKLTGPREVVARERTSFDAFCASLGGVSDAEEHHEHDGHDHGDSPSESVTSGAAPGATSAAISDASSGAEGFVWDVPAGWTTSGPRAMRIVSFVVGANGETECYVTVLGGDGGGVEPNLDRWRDQLGLAPFTSAEFASLPTVEILGVEAALFEGYGSFSGMGAAERDDAGMLGVVCMLADRTLFVKMIGAGDEVRAERENFLRFCRSLGRS